MHKANTKNFAEATPQPDSEAERTYTQVSQFSKTLNENESISQTQISQPRAASAHVDEEDQPIQVASTV